VKILAVLSLAALSLFAAPPPPAFGQARITRTCPVCEGRGKLELVPPDHGQHKGGIESKRYWNVKCACPICKGTGRRTLYRADVPKRDVPNGILPCSGCGFSGVEKCRKCLGTGVVPCRASQPRCTGGWVVTEVAVGSGKNNRHRKKNVDPCAVCGGTGQVVCRDCDGYGGTLCRRCQGAGHDPEKEQRLEERRAQEAARAAERQARTAGKDAKP